MFKSVFALLAAAMLLAACAPGTARHANAERRRCPDSLASLDVPCERIGNNLYTVD